MLFVEFFWSGLGLLALATLVARAFLFETLSNFVVSATSVTVILRSRRLLFRTQLSRADEVKHLSLLDHSSCRCRASKDQAPTTMTEDEEAFLQASQGILEFEDDDDEDDGNKKKEEEVTAIFEESAYSPSPVPNDISAKRHISPKLLQYGAKPMLWGKDVLVGISIAGFGIGTSQGPVGDNTWMIQTGDMLEEMAQSRSIPRPRRKICIPQVVYPTAHVAIEGASGVWMSWDAVDALQDWAQAHHEIAIHSRVAHQGVAIIKPPDIVEWEERRKHGRAHAASSSVMHFDWTFTTNFLGRAEGGQWNELDESGMRTSLLTDSSVPILFFDEVTLYQDDLNGKGHVDYSIKLRVMPTCCYVLARTWVRADNVLVRLRESKVLLDFFGMKPQIYRDVSWRECMWDKLESHGLPTDPAKWMLDGPETQEWVGLIRSIPEAPLPKNVPMHAVFQYD